MLYFGVIFGDFYVYEFDVLIYVYCYFWIYVNIGSCSDVVVDGLDFDDVVISCEVDVFFFYDVWYSDIESFLFGCWRFVVWCGIGF